MCLSCSLICIGHSAQAQVVLDQSQPTDTGASGIGVGYERAQTFTVGVDGTLDRIEVSLDDKPVQSTSDLVFAVYETTLGVPNASSIYSGTITTVPSGTPGYVTLDLSSANIPVSTGDQLAIALTTSDPGDVYGWAWDVTASALDPYAGGQIYLRNGTTVPNWVNSPEDTATTKWDLVFKTYVTVPEPASLAVLVLGGLLTTRRRRR